MASMRLLARPPLINSTPPWTLGQGWTHASGRRCTPGPIYRTPLGSTLAWMSHPAPIRVDITNAVASQKCAGGLDQHVSIFKTDRAGRRPRTRTPDGKATGGCGARGDRPPHRRFTRSPSPWACQESAQVLSRQIPPTPVTRVTAHPPASCSGSSPLP